MNFKFTVKDSFLCRLPHSGDLLEELNNFCGENNISSGFVSVIGAVKSARVGFYNQEKKKYEFIDLNEPMEIVSCTGNISLKDGKPFAHVHITFSDKKGDVFGGHLTPGSVIFAAEACFLPFEGKTPYRGFDTVTGLPLWEEGNK